MNCLQEVAISCPYCGEAITISVDRSVAMQRYIEDCQVCCRPIDLLVNVSREGECSVTAKHENDA
jgi:hypothetical protein